MRRRVRTHLDGLRLEAHRTERQFPSVMACNLELAVQQVRNSFEIEFGSSIDEFLDSIYLAGADIGGTKLENYAKSIERSNKMLNLLNSAVDILRSKHKHGEQYYWIVTCLLNSFKIRTKL